jgi:hypothetical protein
MEHNPEAYLDIVCNDYTAAVGLWRGVKPLQFSRVEPSQYYTQKQWEATGKRGHLFTVTNNGRRSHYFVSVKVPLHSEVLNQPDIEREDDDMLPLDVAKHVGMNKGDRWSNGFPTKDEAFQFASYMASAASNKKMCAVSVLAPKTVGWSKVCGRKGEYYPVYSFERRHQATQYRMQAMKTPDGWMLEGDYNAMDATLPYHVSHQQTRYNTVQMAMFEKFSSARFKTKADLTIGLGLLLRDMTSTSAFTLMHDFLMQFANTDLRYSDDVWIKKFRSIMDAVAHTGLCRGSFEAAVFTEACRATKGHISSEACVVAALLLLRAYGEST